MLVLAVRFRQYEESMETLQADIDSLEREKTEMREKLKDLSRKTLMDGIVRQSTSAGTGHFITFHVT